MTAKNNVLRSMGRKLFAAMLLIGAILVAGCAGGAPGRIQDTNTPSPVSEYHIGPGDELNVFVFNHPDLTLNVPVRPDGLISMPLVESIPATGKTPTELGRDIEQKLSEYVRSPKVNVIVTKFVGTYADQIRVVGEAVHPQALPYRNGMKLLDVVIQVGGLGQYAAGNRARIIRNESGKQTEIKVHLSDLINHGDAVQNIDMRPGDVLIIPQSIF
jgi:polysaccharide export outer membrane protein